LTAQQPPFWESITYLETLVGFLARCDVFSRVGNGYYRNVVVVTAQEVLSSCDDVAQHDGRTQRVENVFVVWVQNEALRYPA
jgi:hypothetical protein